MNILTEIQETRLKRRYKAIKFYAKKKSLSLRWVTYSSFKKWCLLNGYHPDKKLERKDKAAGWTPGNCIWSTEKINKRYRYGIDKMTIKQIHLETKSLVPLSIVRERLKRDWELKEALTCPIHANRTAKKFLFREEELTIRQLKKKCMSKIPLRIIENRVHKGWPIADALLQPIGTSIRRRNGQIRNGY